MSIEIFDCLNREQDICVKTVIPKYSGLWIYSQRRSQKKKTMTKAISIVKFSLFYFSPFKNKMCLGLPHTG